jgi:hypothetical protein
MDLFNSQVSFFSIRNTKQILGRQRNSAKFKYNYIHFGTSLFTKILYFPLYWSERNSEIKWNVNPFEEDYIKNIQDIILAKESIRWPNQRLCSKDCFQNQNDLKFFAEHETKIIDVILASSTISNTFVSTYQSENTVHRLLYTKSKYRNNLIVESDLRLKVTKTKHDIDIIVHSKTPTVSEVNLIKYNNKNNNGTYLISFLYIVYCHNFLVPIKIKFRTCKITYTFSIRKKIWVSQVVCENVQIEEVVR